MKRQIGILFLAMICASSLFAQNAFMPGRAFSTAILTWTNQPSAVTEFMNSSQYRLKIDFTNYTLARLIANVNQAGPAGSTLSVQYSTDLTNWYYLDGSSGPNVSISSTGLKISSTITIAAGARTDVYLRLVGAGGDGATDIGYGLISIQPKQ